MGSEVSVRIACALISSNAVFWPTSGLPTIRTEATGSISSPQCGQIRMSLFSSGVVTHRSRKPNWPVSFTSHAASSKPVIAAR